MSKSKEAAGILCKNSYKVKSLGFLWDINYEDDDSCKLRISSLENSDYYADMIILAESILDESKIDGWLSFIRDELFYLKKRIGDRDKNYNDIMNAIRAVSGG